MPAENPPDNQWSLPGRPTPAQQPPAPLPGRQAMPPQPMPGYPPQPGMPPQPGRFGPEGTIALTLQGNALTSNMLTPQVQIDGHPAPASYGVNYLPVRAGRHTVSAYATWIVKYGHASYDVEVPPGATVPVFYAAPMTQFMKGRMGPVKQKRPGVWLFVVLILVVVVVVVGIAVAANS